MRRLYSSAFLLALTGLAVAAPFQQATVTRTENKVSLGERKADRSELRPAKAEDVMYARNFLQSELNSRAELRYPDGTLVRVGQNTVFSFDSDSRTLALDKGSLIFHMPKGQGGGTIKTPSLTAAITGTAGKVSANIIAVVEGSVKLIPSGLVVTANHYAVRNEDGTISVKPFDPATANQGVLATWNGLMPGFPGTTIIPLDATPVGTPPELRELEVFTRTQNLPGSMNVYFPTPKEVIHKKGDDSKNGVVQTQATPVPQATIRPESTPPSPTPGPVPVFSSGL